MHFLMVNKGFGVGIELVNIDIKQDLWTAVSVEPLLIVIAKIHVSVKEYERCIGKVLFKVSFSNC